MADLFIPGEELESAARNMESVLELLDRGVNPPDLSELLGDSSDVMGAAQSFESRWSDGRTQLTDEAKDIQDGLQQVLDAFQQTDDQLVADIPPPGGA